MLKLRQKNIGGIFHLYFYIYITFINFYNPKTEVGKLQINTGQKHNIKLITINNSPNFVLCLINPTIESIPPIIANINGP